MATWKVPDMSPWRRQALTIPPSSPRAWLALALWEIWMGVLVCGALNFGIRLIVEAPERVVTVLDFTNCYAVPPIVQPCERIAYRMGAMNVVLSAWCGMLLILVAAWLLWELWAAVAPKPITDDFLKLLDDSFARDWRKPRTWPWARMTYAYGFTLVGVALSVCAALLVSAVMSSSAKGPTPRIETSQHFRSVP